MPNIIIFGDSIARWACDYEKQGRVNRLREKIEQWDDESRVYNCGVSGNTTNELVKRFEVESLARKSKHEENGLIIIFAIGINDSAFHTTIWINQVPLKQFNHNIQTLINQAKKLTEKIFIVGLTPVDESKVHPVLRNTEKSYTNEQIHLYDQQLQTLCTQENIPFLSMQNVLEKADLDDGLHPNAQGHQKIFEKVWNELFKLFF